VIGTDRNLHGSRSLKGTEVTISLPGFEIRDASLLAGLRSMFITFADVATRAEHDA
jgi:hypothetical protein